jgi:hypothetical protein
MSNNMKNILEYKSLKVEADKLKIAEVLNKELLKFNFEEDYLKEGDLQIENASEITFNSCVIENYTETRSISESNRPNRTGVPQGSKRISEFNVWDYKLSFDKEFQNSTDNHDILESHHAIGCGTCKQQGKIRCSSCRGAGDVTCSSCSGRGEKQCSNCNGKVDIRCSSCSGKGTRVTGYGDNKRTERCSSCSGRGSNKCSRCSNGYITCSTCSGSGKVTCYTCHGSGDVTCYQCDGNRTMDHFYIVSASFINLSQTLYLTNPYPGFDQNKSKTTNFNIQSKLFDIKEPRFKESQFNDIKSSPFYRQITSFLDFTNNERTKLIASRITCFENKYFEVTFNFYGEKYTLFLDKNFENSYYNGKKPSDQYELDLLRKSLKSASNNELDVAKKTIQKLSKYDFISINEKYIVTAIDDTKNIYEAKKEIDNRNYTNAESSLRLVSDEKKNESDYKRLIKRLDRIYFINTIIFWFISLPLLYFATQLASSDFKNFNFINCITKNFQIAVVILFISTLLNNRIRKIQYSRLLVLLFIVVQSLLLYYYIINQKAIAIKENEKLEEEIKPFKDIITSKFSELGYYVTEVSYQEDKIRFWVKYKNSDSINNGYEYKVGVWPTLYDKTVEIQGEIKDLRGNEETRKKSIINYFSAFNGGETSVLYIKQVKKVPKLNSYVYEVPITFMSLSGTNRLYWVKYVTIINNDMKSMETTVIDETKYNQLAKKNSNQSQIQIGSIYQGGIVINIDETGTHGMLISEADLGSGDWDQAVLLCNKYSNEGFDDWRLPTIEELHIIYENKNLANNFEQNWFWSSTEDTENSDYAFHLGFISGDEMSVPKQHGKFIRAVRNF